MNTIIWYNFGNTEIIESRKKKAFAYLNVLQGQPCETTLWIKTFID